MNGFNDENKIIKLKLSNIIVLINYKENNSTKRDIVVNFLKIQPPLIKKIFKRNVVFSKYNKKKCSVKKSLG